ncbi:hypothetical protein SNE40_022725 [Patella caerulea]|uniref:Uncharacterized protein n=1 Tax=Patella caerulea TaxID=87958 RepID=A0AAN8FX48_PATCE
MSRRILFFCLLILGTFSSSDSFWSKPTIGFIRDVMTVLTWDEITVIYKDVDPLIDLFIEDLLEMLDTVNIRRTIYKMEVSNLITFLYQIHKAQFPNIQILYITTDNPETESHVMKTVNDFDFNSNRTTDFRIKSKWLLLTFPVVMKALDEILTDLCHVTVIYQSVEGCFGVSTLIKKENVNVWTSVPNLSRVQDIFPNVKFHFNGRRLLIGSLPYHLIQKKVIHGISVYSGWMIDLLEDMAADLNFTYEITEPTIGDWGVKTDNNTWDGLIGQVQRREIDILYAEYVITAERNQLMDFILPPFMTSSTGIVYRNPGEKEETWTSLLKPLNTNVYIMLLVSFILFLFLYIATETCPVLDLALEQHREYPKSWQILFDILGCLFLEAGHIHPRTRKGRNLYASWLIFCVVFAAVYTANLTSSLLVKTPKTPFTSLGELVEQKTWGYGLLKNSAIQGMFENSTNEENRNVWEGIVKQNKTDPSVLSENIDDLIDKVLNGNFALIDVRVSKYTMSRNDCALSVIDDIVTTQQSSFAVPLNSPMKEDLDQYMIRRFEAGLNLDLYELKQSPICSNVYGQVKAFSMENIKGSFGILAIGLLVSLLGLLLECLLKFSKFP